MKRLNECSCGCGMMANQCQSNSHQEKPQNYMFFGNLQIIKRAIDALLEMEPHVVDEILADGHDWAADHIATSKDDIQEVADFFINKMGKVSHHPSIMPFVKTFESYMLTEAKKTKKKDQDGDGDSDFADVKIAQYTAGGMDKKLALDKSRKFNKKTKV
jgi:hypothetical protein